MNKKKIPGFLFFLILLYPVISLFLLHRAVDGQSSGEIVEQLLSSYQLSIWLSWLIMVIIAIYTKWKTEQNYFFYYTYIFLFLGFAVFGYYFQKMVLEFELNTPFRDNYTMGVFAGLRNLVVAGLLTGFLQAAVWWFTRRWHRR